jgi:SpoIID/LytB domain protein
MIRRNVRTGGTLSRWSVAGAIAVASIVFGDAPSTRVLRAAQDARPGTNQVLPASPSGLQIRIGVTRPGGGYSVTTMALDAYVARVLAGEAARDSPPAALEALAIAVRTFTLANRNRHGADGFDLCDETHCQVMRVATPVTERAAVATTDRVLLHNGVPASIYYSASCGGRTERPSAVWPGAEDPPYLPSQPDDACGGAPAWSAELVADDLVRALRAAGFRGERLRNIEIVSRTGSGRVGRLRVEGLVPETVSAQDLRMDVGRTLGWQFIRSAAFELKRTGDRYRFSGHGSGHGVGMCVIGSTRLAASGRTADEILQRYFPGLTIGSPVGVNAARVSRSSREPAAAPAPRAPATPPSAPRTGSPEASPNVARPLAPFPELLVSLPDGDESERAFITDLTGRARTALAGELGVRPPRVTLRFHPTIDSFQRATRQPWFTVSATINGDIHLLPPAVLKERGVLDRSIRHELVHVMTNAALAGRRVWVREGAALYFADQSPSPEPAAGRLASPARIVCPGDAELLQPVSVGALTNAYARAEACFARQLAQRRSWKDVR